MARRIAVADGHCAVDLRFGLRLHVSGDRSQHFLRRLREAVDTKDGNHAVDMQGMQHRFGVVDGYFWLLEKSKGFDRGGRVLTVYQLTN